MKIRQQLYNQIISTPRNMPPETGGMLGGHNGIVSAICFDEGMQSEKMCSYIPDTKKLNTVIKEWQQTNILFMGFYHTHFYDVGTLSDGDKSYIERILRNMPAEIEYLYFPLVIMPMRKMICYIAKLITGKLAIEKDDLIIVSNGEMEEWSNERFKRINS